MDRYFGGLNLGGHVISNGKLGGWGGPATQVESLRKVVSPGWLAGVHVLPGTAALSWVAGGVVTGTGCWTTCLTGSPTLNSNGVANLGGWGGPAARVVTTFLTGTGCWTTFLTGTGCWTTFLTGTGCWTTFLTGLLSLGRCGTWVAGGLQRPGL